VIGFKGTLAVYGLQDDGWSNLAKSKCNKFELSFGIRVESFCQQMDHCMIILSLYLDSVGLARVSLVVFDG
jgi:hypothetical protein